MIKVFDTKKDILNYVMVKDGFCYFTDSYILFKRGIATHDVNETIYIPIQEWKKIERKKSIVLAIKDNNVVVANHKNGSEELLYKKDVDFPEVEKLINIDHDGVEYGIGVDVLSKLLNQAKLDGKKYIDIIFSDDKKHQVKEDGDIKTIFMGLSK